MTLTTIAWIVIALLCIAIGLLWRIEGHLRSMRGFVASLADLTEYAGEISENVDAIFHRVRQQSESKASGS